MRARHGPHVLRQKARMRPRITSVAALGCVLGAAVVVLHDGTVDRTTDGAGAVAMLTFAELEQLDADAPDRLEAVIGDRHAASSPAE